MDATITIQENGKPVRFTVRNVPDGATDDEIKAFGQRELAKQRPSNNYAEPMLKRYGATDEMIHSATLGADTYAHGATGALLNAIDAPLRSDVNFDPIGAFEATRKGSLDAAANYEKQHPWSSKTASLGGFVLGAPGQLAMNVIKAPASVGMRMLRGAGVGGLMGAINGFNNTRAGVAEDPAANAGNAGLGLGIGGLIGGVIPGAGALLSPVTRPLGRMVAHGVGEGMDALSRVPIAGRLVSLFNHPASDQAGGIAARQVAEAMKKDLVEPVAAGSAMDEARSLGIPRALADTGENSSRLAGAVARVPGSARTAVRTFLRDRQRAQGERLQGAITRDLGPVGNVASMADQLSAQAKSRAKPLYESAYAAGQVDDPAINELLQHPELQGAFKSAQELHAGDVTLAKARGEAIPPPLAAIDGNTAPDVRTIDYIKRALDRKIDAGYSGDSAAKMQIPFLKDARNLLLSRVDEHVPDFAAARAIYAGTSKNREALEMGQKMVNASEGDIAHATAKMSEGERAQFSLGMRSKLSENLSRRTDLGNKVDYLSNSPQRRDILQQVAGPDANFGQFETALGHERALQDTYSHAMTGSPTAINLADDKILDDAGLAQGVLGRFARGSRNGLWSGITNAAAPLMDASRFGAGKTGERVRDQIAALLTETDPRVFQTALDNAQRDAVKRQVIAGRLGLQTGNSLAALAGRSIADLRQ